MKNNTLHTFVILAYQKSPYLEDCIKSVKSQIYPSKVVLATTTKNTHISELATKYQIKLISGKHTHIGGDFDFALNLADTPLVTIAHQDDIYNQNYSKEIIKAYQKYPNSLFIFTDNYEIRNHQKVYSNTNLKVKRLLLAPIKIKHSLKSTHFKRSLIRFGNPICCPTVTLIVKNCPSKIFASDFKSNCDWHAWERLSRRQGAFTFISKPLVGHRIYKDSATANTINHHIRTKEDYQIFHRFWPKPIAKVLTKI